MLTSFMLHVSVVCTGSIFLSFTPAQVLLFIQLSLASYLCPDIDRVLYPAKAVVGLRAKLKEG